jgi:hypothetical protein
MNQPWRTWLWTVLDDRLPEKMDPSHPDFSEWQETIEAKRALDAALPRVV